MVEYIGPRHTFQRGLGALRYAISYFLFFFSQRTRNFLKLSLAPSYREAKRYREQASTNLVTNHVKLERERPLKMSLQSSSPG